MKQNVWKSFFYFRIRSTKVLQNAFSRKRKNEKSDDTSFLVFGLSKELLFGGIGNV